MTAIAPVSDVNPFAAAQAASRAKPLSRAEPAKPLSVPEQPPLARKENEPAVVYEPDRKSPIASSSYAAPEERARQVYTSVASFKL